MEVVEIGRTPAGLPVYMDANAHAADAIVVVSRVKPHTAFRGPIESGPCKMIAIGLGKQRGAHVLHAAGWERFHETVPQAAAVAIAGGKIAFALATIENERDEPFVLEAVPARELLAREPALLELAKKSLARLPFEKLDVLVIDRIGKNVSGDGADPNVTGRYPTPYGGGGPQIERLVFLDLTDETLGNANGIGLADVVTRRLAERFKPGATYPNALTSTVSEPAPCARSRVDDGARARVAERPRRADRRYHAPERNVGFRAAARGGRSASCAPAGRRVGRFSTAFLRRDASGALGRCDPRRMLFAKRRCAA
jgi:hypothetical protein